MATHHKIKQGSDEWHDIRRGLFTSFNIWMLFTEPRTNADKLAGVLSQTAQTLVEEKAFEVLEFNKPIFTTKATEWGNENEPYAAKAYQEIFDVDVQESGFWTIGENTGSTPDRLISDNGLLEIKNHENQLEHLFNLRFIKNAEDLKKHRKEYYYQVQHQLYVTGREWCDFLSFDPRLFCNEKTFQAGFVCFRIYPNEEVFKLFDEKIQIASELRDKIVNEILDYRIFS